MKFCTEVNLDLSHTVSVIKFNGSSRNLANGKEENRGGKSGITGDGQNDLTDSNLAPTFRRAWPGECVIWHFGRKVIGMRHAYERGLWLNG